MTSSRWLFSQIRGRLPSLFVLVGSNVLGAYLGVVFAVAIQEVIDSATGGHIDRLIQRCIILAAIVDPFVGNDPGQSGPGHEKEYYS